MSEEASIVLFVIVLFIGVPVMILMVRDRISELLWKRRNPPEKIAAERRAYESRIDNPDWHFYEQHLQRGVPIELRNLFDNRALTLSKDIVSYKDEVLSSFAPLDNEGLIETREWIGFDVVPFATSITGDPIYLRPGPDEGNAVYVTYHDGGDTEEIAPHISDFFRQLVIRHADA